MSSGSGSKKVFRWKFLDRLKHSVHSHVTLLKIPILQKTISTHHRDRVQENSNDPTHLQPTTSKANTLLPSPSLRRVLLLAHSNLRSALAPVGLGDVVHDHGHVASTTDPRLLSYNAGRHVSRSSLCLVSRCCTVMVDCVGERERDEPQTLQADFMHIFADSDDFGGVLVLGSLVVDIYG